MGTKRLVFSVVVLLAASAISRSDDKEPKERPDSYVREVINKSAVKYGTLIAKLLGSAPRQEIEKLKSHENWGISLHAAWEQWVDDRHQFNGTYSQSRAQAGALRWLGFVEGKLGTQLPVDWCNSVLTVRSMQNPRRFDTDPNNTDQLWFRKIPSSTRRKVEILPGLHADPAVSALVRKDGNIVELTRGGRRVEIKLDDLTNFAHDGDSFGNGDTVEWVSNDDCEFLILIREGSTGAFNLVMVPESLAAPAWFATGGDGFRSGISTENHRAFISCLKDTVVVFSYSDCFASVDGFDIKTGKAVAKFHSGIW